MKTRLMVIDPSYFSPLYDHHFCNSLAQAGCDVTFVTRKERPGEPELTRLRYKKINLFYKITEIFIRRFPKQKKSILLVKGLEHIFNWIQILLQLKNFDTLHIQWMVLPIVDRFFISFAKKRVQVVFTLHDTNFFHGAPSSRLQTIGYLEAVKSVDAVIVHTQEAIDSLAKQGVARDKIHRITPGALPFLFLGKSKPYIERKNEFLLFGGLKPYKGTDEFLKAFAAVDKAHRKDWKIKVCGHGAPEYIEHLKSLAEELKINDYVTWDIRYVPEKEIPTILFDAKVIAFPYKFVDLSGILWGLLGQEVVILANSVGLFKEVIKNGKSGVLASSEDPLALQNSIKEIVAYPQALSMMAYEFKLSSEKITWASAIDTMENIYQTHSTSNHNS